MSVSPPLPQIHQLSQPVGTRLLKSGTCPTAAWRLTTLATPVTLTQSLFLQMVHSVPPEAKTVLPTCGTWTIPSICTCCQDQEPSTPWLSHQTVTGCAPLSDPPSRSGIWNKRAVWTNWNSRLQEVSHQNAHLCPGPTMATPCSPVTQTTPSVSGQCQTGSSARS